jgi:hypothetical protein
MRNMSRGPHLDDDDDISEYRTETETDVKRLECRHVNRLLSLSPCYSNQANVLLVY